MWLTPLLGSARVYTVVGHKADLLMLHLRPDIDHLHDLERKFDQTLLASCMSRAYSYLSVIEVSRHAAPEGTAGNVEDSPYIQARLYPEMPEHGRYVCFYPMSKKRLGDDNWYMLDAPQRAELMRDHGRTGRKYAGKGEPDRQRVYGPGRLGMGGDPVLGRSTPVQEACL